MAKEFRFNEHNFQNNPGDTILGMNEISSDGWEIEGMSIGFPYVHVLWSREAGSPEQSASLDEGAQALLVAAKAHQVQLEGERDQARNVARQLKEERDRLQEENDALKARLEAASQQPET